jgi:hypothetical protein
MQFYVKQKLAALRLFVPHWCVTVSIRDVHKLTTQKQKSALSKLHQILNQSANDTCDYVRFQSTLFQRALARIRVAMHAARPVEESQLHVLLETKTTHQRAAAELIFTEKGFGCLVGSTTEISNIFSRELQHKIMMFRLSFFNQTCEPASASGGKRCFIYFYTMGMT